LKVHQYVGREPSGRGFNAYKLNHTKLPFNPLVNSGAIATTALISPKATLADVKFSSGFHGDKFKHRDLKIYINYGNEWEQITKLVLTTQLISQKKPLRIEILPWGIFL
jgi:hypothetical protein